MAVWWTQRGRLRPMGIEFSNGCHFHRFEIERWHRQDRAAPPPTRLGSGRYSRVEMDREDRRFFAGRLGAAPRWLPFCARPVRRRVVKRRRT